MGSYKTIRYEVTNRAIRVTIDRPDKRNSLTPEVLQELSDAFSQADTVAEACVVVLRGAGDKAFSAGADLSGMAKEDGFLDLYDARGLFTKLFRQILNLSKPTIAAVNGHCVAGGLGLMLACDLAVARSGAKFGTPEIKRGLFPFMISALLLRTLSRRDAYEMMLLGEVFDSERAHQLGLVNRVVAPENFDDEVEQWISKFSTLSPAVLRLGRRALLLQEGMPIDGALDYLHGLIAMNALLDDAAEGVASFYEKREPVFKGR